jgi:hypothetical protein
MSALGGRSGTAGLRFADPPSPRDESSSDEMGRGFGRGVSRKTPGPAAPSARRELKRCGLMALDNSKSAAHAAAPARREVRLEGAEAFSAWTRALCLASASFSFCFRCASSARTATLTPSAGESAWRTIDECAQAKCRCRPQSSGRSAGRASRQPVHRLRGSGRRRFCFRSRGCSHRRCHKSGAQIRARIGPSGAGRPANVAGAKNAAGHCPAAPRNRGCGQRGGRPGDEPRREIG